MRIYTLLMACVIGLASCSGESGNTNEEGTENATEASMENTTSPSGDALTLESGVMIEMLQEGDGVNPEKGQKVSVHYKGMLEDGTVFDESYKRGEPITFQIGTGQVIPGWEQGVAKLSKGAKAKLTIPSNMAYGASERPGIPANSTLVFEVEVMDIQDGPEPIVHDMYDTEGLKMHETETGLKYYIIEKGTGAKAENGKEVSVHYHGMLEDGKKFDSSFERGEPITFTLGTGQVIPGWEQGISLLKEGAKAQLIIPSDLAYGERGAGGVIPPGATLIFDVELLKVM